MRTFPENGKRVYAYALILHSPERCESPQDRQLPLSPACSHKLEWGDLLSLYLQLNRLDVTHSMEGYEAHLLLP